MNLDKMTPELYENQLRVMNNDAEMGLVHVKQERVEYVIGEKDGVPTPLRVSRPTLQKYSVKTWGSTPQEGMQGYLRRNGYEFTVLHNPNAKPAKKRPANTQQPDAAEPDKDQQPANVEQVEVQQPAAAEPVAPAQKKK